MINYCCKEHLMSICDMRHDKKRQKECKFFLKATREDRCTFLTFGEYCTCLKAHDHCDGKLKEDECECEQYPNYYNPDRDF